MFFLPQIKFLSDVLPVPGSGKTHPGGRLIGPDAGVQEIGSQPYHGKAPASAGQNLPLGTAGGGGMENQGGILGKNRNGLHRMSFFIILRITFGGNHHPQGGFMGKPEGKGRITSYNVCYTKLLRGFTRKPRFLVASWVMIVPT